MAEGRGGLSPLEPDKLSHLFVREGREAGHIQTVELDSGETYTLKTLALRPLIFQALRERRPSMGGTLIRRPP